MNPVFLQLNHNFTTFEEYLRLTYEELIKRNFPHAADKLIELSKGFFSQLSDLFEKFKSGKLTDLVLNFLQQVEILLAEIYKKFKFKNADYLTAVTKALIQTLRNQIIELDLYRQSIIALK